ncbi:Gfo/Idh/MocA family protein [Falsiroseomonas selenitidurans]|uniref:Gfo/Idh/MocA family oxidoreductase n=1 Tax=Falsiroseomonas selenitidurans TaxID=2716335 RepID=A0ABX1EBN3_9PROT|nr:Gfo/Idh/MocA family oxidoreductase [Falsiroseomonas selenitidurans]NKC34228.1 Gfo/Idh/MocA family oxidoreductase [Falsiroseomonas selenitidurans]
MSTPLRAAIIGLGGWGQHLVRSLGPDSAQIRFTAAATRTPGKAQAFAAEHGLRMLDSYAAALADPEVDVVVLATPHLQHTDQILQAAAAGKPVFTEKPLGVDAASAERAARACADAGVTLGVGYNWRYQPALQAIRRMIDDGTLGKVLHIEGNFCGPSAYRFPKGHWRHDRAEGPAGGMTGRGVHVVDAMLYLAGPVAQVTAQSFRLVQDFGMDDTTSMLLRFASGATGYLGTVIATAETWRMQVFGSKGWVEVGDVEHLTTWDLKLCRIDPAAVTVKQRPELITFPKTSTERAELEHFAAHVRAGKPLALPGGDAVHNVALLGAILASIESGAPVRLS